MWSTIDESSSVQRFIHFTTTEKESTRVIHIDIIVFEKSVDILPWKILRNDIFNGDNDIGQMRENEWIQWICNWHHIGNAMSLIDMKQTAIPENKAMKSTLMLTPRATNRCITCMMITQAISETFITFTIYTVSRRSLRLHSFYSLFFLFFFPCYIIGRNCITFTKYTVLLLCVYYYKFVIWHFYFMFTIIFYSLTA